MTRHERFGSRDMTYSRWHRETTGLYLDDRAVELHLCDVDWVEFCRTCWQPLALFELAQDRGDYKKVAIVTVNLARRANLPAAVVFYRADGSADGIASFLLRRLVPTEHPDIRLAPAVYAAWLLNIHDRHRRHCNGAYSGPDAVLRAFPSLDEAA